MHENILEELGLTEAEAKIYLSLVDLGSTTATAIIAKTKLHKGTVYSLLEGLVEKGLITYIIKGRKRYYQAITPERFLEVLKEKEAKFKKILPELLAKHRTAKEKQEAYMLRGKDGVRTVINDILRTKKDFLILGATGIPFKLMPYDFPHFIKKLRKNQINFRAIYVKKPVTKKHLLVYAQQTARRKPPLYTNTSYD